MITRDLTYTETVTMVTEQCCECGVQFGMPSNLRGVLKADPNKYFYCPNGHAQHYTKSTEMKLREQMEVQRASAQKQLDEMRDRFLDELNEKTKLAKQLKRVHNGVCPCCKRSFTNLQRHMKTKHPELAK